jgi:hypothetical protein
VADAEKRWRRRQCGRGQWLARKGLSSVWKIRNALNSLAALPQLPGESNRRLRR